MEIQAEPETLYSTMCAHIWPNQKLTVESKYMKKKWYVRNGQDCDAEAGFEKPVLYVTIQRKAKEIITFGPVAAVGYTPYNEGRGKAKEEKLAILFFCLTPPGVQNFQSIAVSLDWVDEKALLDYSETDAIATELCHVIQEKNEANPWYMWLKTFARSCEVFMLPRLQANYERVKGAPWKKPMKLTVRRPLEVSQSSGKTPSTSAGKTDKGPLALTAGGDDMVIEQEGPSFPTDDEEGPSLRTHEEEQQIITSVEPPQPNASRSRTSSAAASEVKFSRNFSS